MKILIVEDDGDIADFIQKGFEADGYSVDLAADGARGSFLARTNAYDIIILDYSLPVKNGIEACADVRAAGFTTPIIFLSVVGDTKNKILALEKGADDYLTKPFSFEELKARVKALLRRPAKLVSSIIKVGELVIDTEKQTVIKSGLPLYLTRKEYSLLEYLMRNPGVVLSRSMIMEHVWNASSDPFSNTVESHILNLRKKVNSKDSKDFVRNLPGRGYIVEV